MVEVLGHGVHHGVGSTLRLEKRVDLAQPADELGAGAELSDDRGTDRLRQRAARPGGALLLADFRECGGYGCHYAFDHLSGVERFRSGPRRPWLLLGLLRAAYRRGGGLRTFLCRLGTDLPAVRTHLVRPETLFGLGGTLLDRDPSGRVRHN
ncbi:hypothetical protein [Streptomyces mirabilis]|uniref:hypothetical protein n=1 Tax=Streptomyces mirabilis TaxID=68239 RepID=UPI0036D77E86